MATLRGCSDIPASLISGGSGSTSYALSNFTPSCTGGSDTLKKTWNEGSGMWYNITTLPDYTTTEGTGSGASNSDANYGSSNTSQIITFTSSANGGYHAAARYCDKLNYGGYTDWYLPNRFELNLLYINKNSIQGILETTDAYWSSTEASPSQAWGQRMLTGYQVIDSGKLSGLYIRCMRRY